jgi:hypothetical protein
MDLAVKWRLFRYLLSGEDADAVRIYLWHIGKRSGARMQQGLATDAWKRSLDDYLASAASLCRSMAYHGFHPSGAIPIDPDGELLGGAHRVACALALGIEAVPVRRETRYCHAPPWNRAWFLANRVDPDDLRRIDEDLSALVSPPSI